MLSFFVIIILIAVVGLMFVESQVDSVGPRGRGLSLQLESPDNGAFQYAQALLLADPAKLTATNPAASEVKLAAVTRRREINVTVETEVRSMLRLPPGARNWV